VLVSFMPVMVSAGDLVVTEGERSGRMAGMSALTSGTCRYAERQVACPYCHAEIGTRCVTRKNVQRNKPHVLRFALSNTLPELRAAWLRGEL
jgi:hypothetical protein